MAHRKLAPIHPGEILAADFLEPLGLSQYRLAKDITVPARRVNEIVHGTRAISADTALRARRMRRSVAALPLREEGHAQSLCIAVVGSAARAGPDLGRLLLLAQ